ncbi:MAG: Transcriptional regulator, partial [uncultured Craurococcus sp.]
AERRTPGPRCAGAPPEPHRCACRHAGSPPPHPARHEPGKARRGARPHLPAGAEIRARREPHRRQPALRPRPRSRRADRLLLRRHARCGRRLDERHPPCHGLRRQPGRLRGRHAAPPRDARTGPRLLPHHRPLRAEARLRPHQEPDPVRI